MKHCFTLCLVFVLNSVLAGDPYPRNESIDVRHYVFKLDLNDSTNNISGESTITIRFKKALTSFELDLVGINASGQGMKVSAVLIDSQPLKFIHQNDRLAIEGTFRAGDEKQITVRYGGIPQDGLIISKNKFGDRTFFGDNWPNRAHHWLPTIDHPYDKATCEFIVTAPEHYTVIGTGEKIEESCIGKNQKLTHWRTSVILPTKVMVIGVARFAIHYEGLVEHVPLETWVYPQNRVEGFSDYSIAAGPLALFSKMIAPYPFEKLANVQSTTRYGGMENAGNIFYYENSVSGKGNIEGLIAHEIAHQWFGDSASEADWFHVWLSEGFATYLSHVYSEEKYGAQKMAEEMVRDRKQVIEYFAKDPSPVVPIAIGDISKVLNTNSYQKGSWVLHMLRQEIGDQKFWEGVREYYRQYQLSNALTDDFRRVMETVSGKNLQPFFDQWVFRAGHPKLDVTWAYEPNKKMVTLTVDQKQEKLFHFPLEVAIGSETKRVMVGEKRQEIFAFPAAENVKNVILDPETRLLFDGIIKRK